MTLLKVEKMQKMTKVLKNAVLVVATSALACRSASRAQRPPSHMDMPVNARGAPQDSSVRFADIGKTCGPESPTFTVSRERMDSVPDTFRARVNASTYGRWYDLSTRTSMGFGGVFRHRKTHYVFLADTSQLREAITALNAMPSEPGPPRIKLTRRNTRALHAHWTFAQLADWVAYIASHHPPVYGPHVQEPNNWIEFGVLNDGERQRVQAFLRTLDLPCDLVVIRRIEIHRTK